MKTTFSMTAAKTAVGIAIVVAAAATANAHSGATGIVKERMVAMGDMGKVMKSLAPMMRGELEYNADKVREGAAVIQKHAGQEGLVRLFPEGTGDMPSVVSPAVWNSPEEFAELAETLAVYAEGLGLAADNPPSMGAGGAGGAAGGAGAMMGGTGGASSMMGGSGGASAMMGGSGNAGNTGNSGNPGGTSSMMGGASGAASGMMGGVASAPSLEKLAALPVNQVFAGVGKTCAACHGKYRLEAK